MTVKDLILIREWAEKHEIIPGIIETEKQAKAYTEIDKILGIDHEWKVGDEYYLLLCPIIAKLI